MSNKKRIKKLLKTKYKSNSSNWNRFVQIFSEYKMGYNFMYSGGRLSGRSWKIEKIIENFEKIRLLQPDKKHIIVGFGFSENWEEFKNRTPKRYKFESANSSS